MQQNQLQANQTNSSTILQASKILKKSTKVHKKYQKIVDESVAFSVKKTFFRWLLVVKVDFKHSIIKQAMPESSKHNQKWWIKKLAEWNCLCKPLNGVNSSATFFGCET